MIKKFYFFILVATVSYLSLFGYWYLSFNRKIDELEVAIVAKDMLSDEDRVTSAKFVEEFSKKAVDYFSTQDVTAPGIQSEISSQDWKVWDYYFSIYDYRTSKIYANGYDQSKVGLDLETLKSVLGKDIFALIHKKLCPPDKYAWVYYYWKDKGQLAAKAKFAYGTRFEDIKGHEAVLHSSFHSNMPFPHIETYHQLGRLLYKYKGKVSKSEFNSLRTSVEVVTILKDLFLTTYSDEKIKEFINVMYKEVLENANVKLVYYHGDDVIASIGAAHSKNKIFELVLKSKVQFEHKDKAHQIEQRRLAIFFDEPK